MNNANLEFVRLQSELGLSNNEVADMLGVSTRTILHWHKGTRNTPNIVNELLKNKLEKWFYNIVIIPTKSSGTGTIHDLESQNFERYVEFGCDQNFAFVKAAQYDDDEFSFYETLDDAVMADKDGYTGKIVAKDGTVYSDDGMYLHKCYDDRIKIDCPIWIASLGDDNSEEFNERYVKILQAALKNQYPYFMVEVRLSGSQESVSITGALMDFSDIQEQIAIMSVKIFESIDFEDAF